MIMTGYLIAKWLYGCVEGILTGVILCLMPLDIVFSSQIMPDLPQAALGGIAVLLFLAGKKCQNNGYFVLSGITIAVSVFTKEFAVLYYSPHHPVNIFLKNQFLYSTKSDNCIARQASVL